MSLNVRFVALDALFTGETDDVGAIDAGQDVAFPGRKQAAVLDDEDVASQAPAMIAVLVQQDRPGVGVELPYVPIRHRQIEVVLRLRTWARRRRRRV